MADNSRPVSRTVGADERPRTRWRRDERPMTRAYAEDRPSITDLNQIMNRQTAGEDSRPTSRRGAKEDRMAETPSMGRVTARPGSSSRQGMTSRLAGKMSIQERPLTQQGVMRPPSSTALKGTGLKPVATGGGNLSQRQVQDRSFFMGLIRAAMGELGAEISKLRAQSEEMRAEKSAAQVYEKRVRELAEELTGLQEQLSDYNSLVDKLNTGASVNDVNLEISQVEEDTQRLANEVENKFSQKQTLEAQANSLKEQLKQEQEVTETLVAQLPPSDQAKFAQLQQDTIKLDSAAEILQTQLDALSAEKTSLEDQIADSEVHQELLRLRRRLHELSTRRDALAEEEKSRQSPGQQRDALLAAVKAHNTELAALDSQTEREKQNITALQASISQAQQALEQSGSERQSQYSELKKREAVMEEFLAGFESAMSEEKQRRAALEVEVTTALGKCSSLLVQTQQLPSVEQFSELREQLGVKEGEVERAKFTSQGLGQQEQQLKLQMERVTELEKKVSTEMSTLRSKMAGMQTEMARLADLPGLREREEQRRRDVEEKRDKMSKQRDETLKQLEEAKQKLNEAQCELADNELWSQLSHLEHKWSQAVQNNFALSEHLASRQVQADYQPIRERALQLIANHNQSLRDSLMKSHHA